MTEHKFTDEELQKCMDCCIKAECWGDCKDLGCPATTKQGCRFYLRTDDDYENTIYIEILKDALDLISRQKAEIDRLNKEVDRLSQCVLYHDGQIADAIKDFADELEHRLIDGGIFPAFVKNQIDCLVKETTEGE